MSQFTFFNDIHQALTLDGDITKGPAPRWKKKLEASISNLNNSSMNATRSALSISYNNSFSGLNKSIRTPSKNAENKSLKITMTPGRGKVTLTSSTVGGDRFIPNRSGTNFELSSYLVKQDRENNEENDNNVDSEDKIPLSKSNHQKLISESMQIADSKTTRILSYQKKPPAPTESHINPLKVVYSMQTPLSTKSGSRYIPSTSERILDAPDIINDYYLNLLDWNSDNIVAVALGNCVYLWNAASGSIQQLIEYEEGDHACALAWIQEGQILAVGNNTGAVELWDCSKTKRLRVMDGHSARVGTLAWNSYIVTSGSRDSSIVHHDVRSRQHMVNTLNGHTQEVCGLKWSTDFKYLASGSNDNLVNIWPAIDGGGIGTETEPLHILNQHQAAVRALAWCPWQSNLLASGGGTADRTIKFWNVNNGSLINSVDTKSQVCALLWSQTYKELISGHGFANNQLTIWKYPSMAKQAELTGHTARVLHMALSPDGSSVISAGADETLRVWNCFAPDPHTTKKTTAIKTKQSAFRQSIR